MCQHTTTHYNFVKFILLLIFLIEPLGIHCPNEPQNTVRILVAKLTKVEHLFYVIVKSTKIKCCTEAIILDEIQTKS